MFGYVRPLKGDLKVREFEEFKAAYCGLCHTLRRNYGQRATLLLSYDMTFLAMLIDGSKPVFTHCRCVSSPLKKKCVCAGGEGLDKAADYCVILSYHKLRDDVRDKGFFKGLAARFASRMIRGYYKKACKKEAVFDKLVLRELAALGRIEAEQPASIDIPADCFAKILAAMAGGTENQAERERLLYHMGRWIYILDAVEDLPEDVASGGYNPLVARFGLSEGKLSEEDSLAVSTTLMHSENLMCSAFLLLPQGYWAQQLTNILCMGMPAIANEVLAGVWRKKRDRHPK